MTLISIAALIEHAKAKGFRVHGGPRYAELYSPQHTGPDRVWYGGSPYSCCNYILCDRPSTGYGYNNFFYGPWHHGHVRSNDWAVKNLLAHPAMADFDVYADDPEPLPQSMRGNPHHSFSED